ncbi:calcium-binding protein 39-like [Symsagittifera roscoffensis]|uniref:calcium-binding protein 39-like n=1 Tax=Symsagittifera roscoffensis TaxID=84072 RepID=UPI00307C43D4
MPIFGRSAGSTKSPSETVKSLLESLTKLGRADVKEKDKERENENVHKMLLHLKAMLSSEESSSDLVLQVCNEIHTKGVFQALILDLDKIGFESRKLFTEIFYHMITRQIGTNKPTIDYLVAMPELIYALMDCYQRGQEVALTCGTMLRYCIKYSSDLTSVMLNSEKFFTYFQYVEMQPFDLSSDAFSSFKDMLTIHKQVAASFLEANYDRFFSEYKVLLDSGNYVTKRQSLKLLGELLLDRHNFAVMTKYISSVENLKQIMNLLKDNSRSIQFEAFHVFKVFVANPNKTREVNDILVRNKDKLIEFLSSFQTDRQEEDQQFLDEKTYLIRQITQMS